MTFTRAWQAVADAYDEDMAIALRARDWETVESMTDAEFVAGVKARDAVRVSDAKSDIDSAKRIFAAMDSTSTSEDAVLDVLLDDDDDHARRGKSLRKIANKQNEDRISGGLGGADRKIAPPAKYWGPR